jgi:tetratricopeptide (TPR) repeat protein
VLLIFILTVAGFLTPAKADIEGDIMGVQRQVEAPASLKLFNGKTLVQSTMPDAHGHFKFSKIDPGAYVIHVESDGYYAKDVPVQVANTTSHVTITLERTPDNPATKATFDPFRSLNIPRPAKKEYDLGMRAQKDGNCDMRLLHLQKAVSLYPQYGEAYTEIARCYLQMNDMASAETAFKRAIPISPGVYASVNLATLYINEGKIDEASILIAPLLQKNPTEGELYAAAARIHFAKGRMREAEAAALEAHTRGHRSPDIHLILAKIYEDQGRRGALLTQLLEYLDENPRGGVADQVRRQIQALQNQ